MECGFYDSREDTVRIFARISPGAAKDEIVGIWHGGESGPRLAVKVAAAPDKGKANAAIIKLLSRTLGLPKSSVSIIAGETSRLKTLALAGDQAEIVAAIDSLIGEIE